MLCGKKKKYFRKFMSICIFYLPEVIQLQGLDLKFNHNELNSQIFNRPHLYSKDVFYCTSRFKYSSDKHDPCSCYIENCRKT